MGQKSQSLVPWVTSFRHWVTFMSLCHPVVMLKDALLITLADSSCPVHNALMLHKAQALYKAVFAKEPCCRFRRLISKPLLMWGVGFINPLMPDFYFQGKTWLVLLLRTSGD